ncbi:hypothetical protein D3C87_2186720 [compost metagenome]
MIQKVLAQDLQAQIEVVYPPDGVVCIIVSPLDVISCNSDKVAADNTGPGAAAGQAATTEPTSST